MKDCMNCAGAGWVCESHLDRPWGGYSDAVTACDCGGAGSPCPVCNADMAFEGRRVATILECAAVAFAPFDWRLGEAPTTYRALADRIGSQIKNLQFTAHDVPQSGGVFSTEALRQRLDRDSDGSPKGGDAEGGSVRSTTARPEGIAQ